MRKQHFIYILMSMGSLFGLWKSVQFKQDQELAFNTHFLKYQSLQVKLKTLEEDQRYLRNHDSEIQFLMKKNWHSSENRLIVGEVLENISSSYVNIHYIFEPEQSKQLGNDFVFKVTKIGIDVDALLDTDVYVFTENLVKNFPGILYVAEISLGLNEQEPPPYIKGNLVFDWYSMGGEG